MCHVTQSKLHFLLNNWRQWERKNRSYKNSSFGQSMMQADIDCHIILLLLYGCKSISLAACIIFQWEVDIWMSTSHWKILNLNVYYMITCRICLPTVHCVWEQKWNLEFVGNITAVRSNIDTKNSQLWRTICRCLNPRMEDGQEQEAWNKAMFTKIYSNFSRTALKLIKIIYSWWNNITAT